MKTPEKVLRNPARQQLDSQAARFQFAQLGAILVLSGAG